MFSSSLRFMATLKTNNIINDSMIHHPLLLKWFTSELQLAHSSLFYIELLSSCLQCTPLPFYSRKFAALCATMYLPINDLITPERLLKSQFSIGHQDDLYVWENQQHRSTDIFTALVKISSSPIIWAFLEEAEILKVHYWTNQLFHFPVIKFEEEKTRSLRYLRPLQPLDFVSQ